MKLSYTAQASNDLDKAISWYEDKQKGLGIAFLDCVEATIFRILDHPTLYPIKHKTLRAALIRKFPYTIFYQVKGQEIVIHAVFDNRSSPSKRP